MAREECSFIDACDRLSSGARPVPLRPAPIRAVSTSGRKWEQLRLDSPEAKVLERLLVHYEQALWTNTRARAYLARRGVSEETARAERLGYADGRSLLEVLRKGNPDDMAMRLTVELGVVLERPGPDERVLYREFLVDRLVVPELRNGRPIWFIGRRVDDPDADSDSAAPARRPRPKYLGLPGEKPLFGLDHVRGKRAVYLVEGPFDVLAGLSWQLPTFAICGTHFPSERLAALGAAEVVCRSWTPIAPGRALPSASLPSLAAGGARSRCRTTSIWPRSPGLARRVAICSASG